nr:MAG TPA: hypothetical protein [Caudoviricetes sp.]
MLSSVIFPPFLRAKLIRKRGGKKRVPHDDSLKLHDGVLNCV